jgi:hypothetical protein
MAIIRDPGEEESNVAADLQLEKTRGPRGFLIGSLISAILWIALLLFLFL